MEMVSWARATAREGPKSLKRVAVEKSRILPMLLGWAALRVSC